MRLFWRNAGAPQLAAPPPELAAAVDVGSNAFVTQLVPEANFESELDARAPSPGSWQSLRIVLTAESANRFNPSAVAIRTEGGDVIGYLPRELGQDVQPLLLALYARRQLYASCSARVVREGERPGTFIDLDRERLRAAVNREG